MYCDTLRFHLLLTLQEFEHCGHKIGGVRCCSWHSISSYLEPLRSDCKRWDGLTAPVRDVVDTESRRRWAWVYNWSHMMTPDELNNGPMCGLKRSVQERSHRMHFSERAPYESHSACRSIQRDVFSLAGRIAALCIGPAFAFLLPYF